MAGPRESRDGALPCGAPHPFSIAPFPTREPAARPFAPHQDCRDRRGGQRAGTMAPKAPQRRSHTSGSASFAFCGPHERRARARTAPTREGRRAPHRRHHSVPIPMIGAPHDRLPIPSPTTAASPRRWRLSPPRPDAIRLSGPRAAPSTPRAIGRAERGHDKRLSPGAQPLLRKAVAMALMVSSIPSLMRGSASPARCRFRSSTCNRLSGSI